jgi:hypothetical protein
MGWIFVPQEANQEISCRCCDNAAEGHLQALLCTVSVGA